MMTRSHVASIGEVLGNWATGHRPLYQSLAAAFRDAILRGDLRPEEVLPPERVLAQTLAVSRTTVIAALEQLKDEGWVEARHGRGTWVRRRPGDRELRGADPIPSLRGNPSVRDEELTTIDLATATVAPSQHVIRTIGALTPDDARELADAASYAPQGLPQLRRAVAEYVSELGVPTTPHQVLITTGSQQAIALLAAHFLRSSDTFIVENPTSPGALDAFRATGARARWIAVGPDGADVDALSELLSDPSRQCVYAIPTYQSPTGTVMPVERRRALAGLADRLQIPMIEDLSQSWLPLDEGSPPPAVASFSSADQVVIVDSMSKLFWSGLRIGWIRAGDGLIHRLSHAKTLADLGTPLLSQLVAARLLPVQGQIRAERREVLSRRLLVAKELLGSLLPDWTWSSPRGGVAIWVRIPHGSARGLAQHALRFGVTVVAGPLLAVDDSYDDHLRISFGLPEAELEEGIRRLAAAWVSYRTSPDRLPEAVVI
jgi:DNA-binding transcriptional MocR family regulator